MKTCFFLSLLFLSLSLGARPWADAQLERSPQQEEELLRPGETELDQEIRDDADLPPRIQRRRQHQEARDTGFHVDREREGRRGEDPIEDELN
jgi:hypothetical protein